MGTSTVKRPLRTVDGVQRYEIVQRVAEVEILPGVRTPVFGYDGLLPGPTSESRRGRSIVVRHHNELPVPTVVHLHGGHTPAAHDGWPTDLVLPAGEHEYAYPMDQRAATLWYHDHRMDFTGPQVYRGLAAAALPQPQARGHGDDGRVPNCLTVSGRSCCRR